MSLQDLIPVVNKLQDIVTNTNLTDLDLPILTVIGSQSAGKSSVLENIVGKDFLPRGTGIVTRRPLVLQLININDGNESLVEEDHNDSKVDANGDEFTLEDHLKEKSRNEWGEFLHIPNKRFYNFGDIRKEIENETARIAGKNKGISRLPINLKVYSPNVLNLTMVDLPGLTKIPIGDQPTDIERQIKNLILEYIAKPNSIILAVSPANVDLVNSESLKLARQVDPQGKRTVGILSKIDLMDQGTNALDILTGKVYPLKLGFIGIVNRSQQDIAVNKSLPDSLRAEEEFFHNHPAYRSIASKCGTKYLAKTLNQTLMHHIREKLPDIKAKLNTLMGQTEQELASYGDAESIADENRGVLILQLMTKFATNFVNSIEGNSTDISTKELCGGARIYYIYNEVFGQSLATINPTSNLTTHDIRTAIRNSTGPRPSLFVPELAFDLLVKPQIQLLEGPSKRCVELVYEELMKICHNSGSVELDRYPKLQTRLIEVVSELLRERLGPTTKYVESLIEIHRAYINTNHPNFVGAATAMASVVEERQQYKQQQQPQARPQKLVENNTENGSAKEGDDHKSDQRHKSFSSHSSGHAAKANTKSTQEATVGKDSDSFLNFFFGKDQTSQEVTVVEDDSPFPSLESNQDISMKITQTMDKLKLKEQDDVDSDLSEREQMECELIRRLIISYFGIIREMIQDQVPKSVMCLLVNYIKESIQNRLVSKLYKDELFDELLFEDEAISAERHRCEKLLATYREASDVIGEVI